jgi:hypothetical protein
MKHSYVLTRDGREPITATDPDETELKRYEFIKKRKGKRVNYYCPEFMAFDIETSHTDVEAWLYQWAIKFDNKYIYGRTPTDFINFLKRCIDFYKLSENKKIFIVVHNLSYEMQYLKHYLNELTHEHDSEMEVLATDAHNYISVDIYGFKFVCSWKLSNLNLDLFSKSYGEKYLKASGEIDYSKVHYQDERLDPSDWFYQFSDVAATADGIKGLLKAHNFEYLHDAPLTTTGFVRNDCRKKAKAEMFWRKKFVTSRLDLNQYDMCRQAFMGGITICNYQYSGVTVRGLIGHRDFTSSYPARQMMNYFPSGRPAYYGEIESDKEFRSLLDKYCCVFYITMYDLHIKEGVTAPYIPSSKCVPALSKEILKVNGKVVFAEQITMAICEIDFNIIEKQYDIKGGYKISNLIIFHRGEMPKFLKDRVMYYFKNKCTLKHSDPMIYLASKGNLNGIYGMTAQRIIREEYKPDENLILKNQFERGEEVNRNSKLEEYYNNRNSFLPYQYSLYTTAWARYELIRMIECVGYDKFLYCDTDSIFYLKDPETEKALELYNNDIVALAKEKGAFIDDKILGYADKEEDLRAFRGLHAKCYAMEDLDGKLSCTIAGIPKKATKWIDGKPVEMTNAQELGDIDKLDDGFIFKHCGGTRAIYIERTPANIQINAHNIELASGVIIENIEKEINDTMFTVGKDYSLLKINRQIFT